MKSTERFQAKQDAGFCLERVNKWLQPFCFQLGEGPSGSPPPQTHKRLFTGLPGLRGRPWCAAVPALSPPTRALRACSMSCVWMQIHRDSESRRRARRPQFPQHEVYGRWGPCQALRAEGGEVSCRGGGRAPSGGHPLSPRERPTELGPGLGRLPAMARGLQAGRGALRWLLRPAARGGERKGGCSGLPGKPDGQGPGSLCPPALRLLGRPRPLHGTAGTSHITRNHFSIVRALIFSFGFLLIFTNIMEDEQAWDPCVSRRRCPLRRAGESRGVRCRQEVKAALAPSPSSIYQPSTPPDPDVLSSSSSC